jgi:hypothetical protein
MINKQGHLARLKYRPQLTCNHRLTGTTRVPDSGVPSQYGLRPRQTLHLAQALQSDHDDNPASNSAARSVNKGNKRPLEQPPPRAVSLPVNKVARTGSPFNLGRKNNSFYQYDKDQGLDGARTGPKDQEQKQAEGKKTQPEEAKSKENGSEWEGCENEEAGSRASSSERTSSSEGNQVPMISDTGTSVAAARDNEPHSAPGGPGSGGNEHDDGESV